MISKADWQNAYRDLVEDGRERLGDPPTFEEVEKLLHGELQGAEAERVRELLAYYPELAQVMLSPLPAEADAAGVLTEEQVAEDLAKIRARIGLTAPVARRRGRRTWARRPLVRAVAALVIVAAIGAVYLEMQDPRMTVVRAVPEDGQFGVARGGASQTPIQLSTQTDYLLKLLFEPERQHRQYRVELVGLSPQPRSIWIREDVQRAEDGSYPVKVETDDLAPGRYQLVLYGRDEEAERLATYTIRVFRP